MIFNAKRQVTVEEAVIVDDRIYQVETLVWQMANMILEDRLRRIADDLYHDDYYVAQNASECINRAFKRADECLKLVKEGKYEI